MQSLQSVKNRVLGGMMMVEVMDEEEKVESRGQISRFLAIELASYKDAK